MPEKFSLQPLLDLAATRMDDATRRLGELIASEKSDLDKLGLLQRYRHEYSERFSEAAKNGISTDTLRNYSAFLAKLDEAVEAQTKILEQARIETSRGQKAWMNERTRARAFDTLNQRFQNEVLRKESRQEQRTTDEHASRAFRERREET